MKEQSYEITLFKCKYINFLLKSSLQSDLITFSLTNQTPWKFRTPLTLLWCWCIDILVWTEFLIHKLCTLKVYLYFVHLMAEPGIEPTPVLPNSYFLSHKRWRLRHLRHTFVTSPSRSSSIHLNFLQHFNNSYIFFSKI